MGKLVGSAGFVEGEWLDDATRKAIAEHNLKVRIRWIAEHGDSDRPYWWHVTEITLDHFRPSPDWLRQGETLRRAKEQEAIEARGLIELAKRRKAEEEKMRMLREVAKFFNTTWASATQAGVRDSETS